MDDLQQLVAEELARPSIRASPRWPPRSPRSYGEAARAVLFYGSCLRQSAARRADARFLPDRVRLSRGLRPALAGARQRAVPPNVFPFEHDGLAAKYAVLSEADFVASTGPRRATSRSGRGSPSRRGWSGRQTSRPRAHGDRRGRAGGADPARRAPADGRGRERARPAGGGRFALTYSAELRAERKGRAASIVDADPERYRRFAAPRCRERPIDRARSGAAGRGAAPRARRCRVVRLAKASATYAGGVDYLAWKINRHAGTDSRSSRGSGASRSSARSACCRGS